MTSPTNDIAPPRASRAERIMVLGGLGVAAALLLSAVGTWTERTQDAELAAIAQRAPAALTPAERLVLHKQEASAAKRRLARTDAVRSYAADVA